MHAVKLSLGGLLCFPACGILGTSLQFVKLISYHTQGENIQCQSALFQSQVPDPQEQLKVFLIT